MGRVKRLWYLSPMGAAKVQASLRIRAVSPEPPLLAHKSSESRGTFRQKAISLAPLNVWTCAVKICHDGMLEDTNSLDGVQLSSFLIMLEIQLLFKKLYFTTLLIRNSVEQWLQLIYSRTLKTPHLVSVKLKKTQSYEFYCIILTDQSCVCPEKKKKKESYNKFQVLKA